MSDVVPQFDFGANDVPTRELLIRQALSLRIVAINDLITRTSFLKVRAGADSGSTGANTSTGDMWMSPGEQMFVDFGDGPVVVWNPDGWWETNRYNVRDIYSEKLRGFGVYPPGPDGGTSENGIRWDVEADGYETGGPGTISHTGLVNESAFSGHCRILGHGPAMYGLASAVDYATTVLRHLYRPIRVIGNSPSAFFWTLQALEAGTAYRGWMGYACGLAPQSSAYSGVSNERVENAFYGHFTGVRMIGPGDTD